MIGNMAVRITADRPNFPLGTLFVRAGSAANIALVGVPVRPGVSVTALALRVENVDGATADYAARAIGGVWIVDVPASHFATVGSVAGGVSVWATGTGADGETPRTWCVGVGDLEVLSADADAPAPAPGQTFWPLRMFDAAPTAPTKYNAYIDGAALKIWNGVAWITISGGSGTVDDTVTRTSANPVKSSGIWGAIWGALTALPTGFTAIYDWVVAQLAGKVSTSGETYTFGESLGGLFVGVGSNDMYEFSPADLGGANTIARRKELSGKYEKPVTGIPASDLAQAVQTALSEIPGKADAADLRYRIAEAEYSASVGTAGGYILEDRTENYIVPTGSTSSIDIELPAMTGDYLVDRRARDFFLDIDNSQNASDLTLEFTGLGVSDLRLGYSFVTDADDDIVEMTKVESGKRARLYFTEIPEFDEDSLSQAVPVFHVARVTLSDFITSTTTQGGNS